MSDNAQGFAGLEAMIAKVKSLGNLARDGAPAVARELKAQIAEAISEGRTPEGQPWKPTVDGHMPLRNAMSAIDVVSINTDVIATLRGYHVFHQMGSQSKHARAAERTASTARAKAKAAAKYVRRTERGGTVSKKAQAKAESTAAAATAATAKHAEVKSHGGLPQRRMIPEMMSAELGAAIVGIYKARFAQKMAGAA